MTPPTMAETALPYHGPLTRVSSRLPACLTVLERVPLSLRRLLVRVALVGVFSSGPDRAAGRLRAHWRHVGRPIRRVDGPPPVPRRTERPRVVA